MYAVAEAGSYFSTYPLFSSASWLLLAIASFAWGARVFRHISHLAPDCVCWAWWPVAYGTTFYGVSTVGWMFDTSSAAVILWEWLSFLSAGMSLVGMVVIAEKAVSYHLSRQRQRRKRPCSDSVD